MKVGIQLFGVLKHWQGDTMEALRMLREWGYKQVEPCISLAPIPGMEKMIWPADWYLAHAEEIGETGLETLSCHLFAENPEPAMLGALASHGIRQFVVKPPKDLSDAALQEAAMRFMRMADILTDFGAELLIHNEADDIRTKSAGKTAFEHLLDLCMGRAGAEVDVGWVMAGGEDPEALLWRNAGRIKALHFKDFTGRADGLTEIAVGSGCLDLTACLQFARAFGCTQVVDMDSFPSGLREDLRSSREALARLEAVRERTVSYLNTLDVETGEIHTLKKFDGVIEAPNWLKKTRRILYNADGFIWFYDLDTGAVTKLDTGICDHCNNDHVVSPDEQYLAVSHMTFEEGFSSRVYVVPMEGGEARKVTPNSPSFLHGWSPDGKEFAYCAFREIDGRREVDIYTIPAEGGEETRLTQGGFNDGSEYSPDGKHIWFNSTRSGLMQLWRMNRDGSEQTQMTFSDRNNWFGHISPDGRKVVWISYGRDDLEASEHLPNMQVELWIMNADGSEPRKLATLFGGQGSINVNSWAGDSRHLAFVSYELLHP